MKKGLRSFLGAGILLSWLLACPLRAAEPLAVVAGAASNLGRLTREEVAAAFLGEKRALDSGQQIATYDLDDDEVKQQFYRYAAHRSLMQLRAYWARMVFTGSGRPPENLPANRLIEKLRTDPNAIGYLPTSRTAGLKILLRLPAE